MISNKKKKESEFVNSLSFLSIGGVAEFWFTKIDCIIIITSISYSKINIKPIL
ncbi:hypothetical protein B4080_6053 [Bacillus cereus]|nr:hypothetical protein B4080_6053 [Bacillus cereus]